MELTIRISKILLWILAIVSLYKIWKWKGDWPYRIAIMAGWVLICAILINVITGLIATFLNVI